MKRMNLFLIVMILSAVSIFPQTLTGTFASEKGAYQLYIETALAGQDTLVSPEIDLSKGISNITLIGKKLFTSASSKPRIKLIHQEKLFGTWTDTKTIYTADSTETVQTMTPDTLRAPLSRYLIIGTATNASDTIVKLFYRFLKLF